MGPTSGARRQAGAWTASQKKKKRKQRALGDPERCATVAWVRVQIIDRLQTDDQGMGKMVLLELRHRIYLGKQTHLRTLCEWWARVWLSFVWRGAGLGFWNRGSTRWWWMLSSEPWWGVEEGGHDGRDKCTGYHLLPRVESHSDQKKKKPTISPGRPPQKLVCTVL